MANALVSQRKQLRQIWLFTLDHTVGYVIFLPLSYSFALNICNALEAGEKAKGKDIFFFFFGLFCFWTGFYVPHALLVSFVHFQSFNPQNKLLADVILN